MSSCSSCSGELMRTIVRMVVAALEKRERAVPIGVSNRHVHLSREDMDALFGVGSELTHRNDLGQPGQYAAEETVSIKGPKNKIDRVRVLGPLRAQTQIEISVADGFTLGVRPPIRESGKLQGTPGLEIIGPKGSIRADHGVIAALRHIHMHTSDAERLGLHDKQILDVEIEGVRGAVLKNVLLRVSDQYALEMHVDVDEANAMGLKNGDSVYIVMDRANG